MNQLKRINLLRNIDYMREALLILIIALTSGCGGSNEASLTGTITLNGTPLDRGSVTFLPVDTGRVGATAQIRADGFYEARTASQEGLSVGDYVATVRANGDPIPNPNGGPPFPGKLLTPKKYGSRSTSDLRITVQPGSNDIDLELKT